MTVKSPANWRPGQRIKNNIIYGIIRFLLFIVQLMPGFLITAMGVALGFLGYYLDGHDRRRALSNLDLAFGDTLSKKEKRRLAKASFLHLGRAAAEIITGPRRLKKHPEWITIPEYSQKVWYEAMASGKGVVAYTGHIGHWELLSRAALRLGTNVYTVAKELYDPRLTELIENFRGESGLKILWRRRHQTIRPQIVELLQSGALIAFLNDQAIKVPGEYLPFFGKPAWTATGAAALAWQTGATIIAGALVRQKDGSYSLEIEAIPRPEAETEELFAHQLNLLINDYYERIIKKYPEQWVWLHHRWRKFQGPKVTVSAGEE